MMSGTRHLGNSDEAESVNALVPERTVVGLCRHGSDLRRLIALLRVGGIDVRKLSVVMLNGHRRRKAPSIQDDESRALRTGLIIDGAVRHDTDEGSLLVAGPIKTCLTIDFGTQWFFPGLTRALDQTLSAWGVDVKQRNLLEAGIAAGRYLVVLHPTLFEVPTALEVMRRASADHVAMVGHCGSLRAAEEEGGGSSNDEDEK